MYITILDEKLFNSPIHTHIHTPRETATLQGAAHHHWGKLGFGDRNWTPDPSIVSLKPTQPQQLLQYTNNMYWTCFTVAILQKSEQKQLIGDSALISEHVERSCESLCRSLAI